MQRRTTRATTPAERVGAVIVMVLCAGLIALGTLMLLGVVLVSGSGEGTLAVQLISGGLFAILGLGGLGTAIHQLLDGHVTVEPPAPPVDANDPSTDPYHAFGFGAYGPGGRQPYSNGEF